MIETSCRHQSGTSRLKPHATKLYPGPTTYPPPPQTLTNTLLFHRHYINTQNLLPCTPRQNPCTCRPTVLGNKVDSFILSLVEKKKSLSGGNEWFKYVCICMKCSWRGQGRDWSVPVCEVGFFLCVFVYLVDLELFLTLCAFPGK